MAYWPQFPLAYFITFTCYGTRLHGRVEGSVDRTHNAYLTEYLLANPRRRLFEYRTMSQAPYMLDRESRDIVLAAIREVCTYRQWTPFVVHVRTNHVHTVVEATTAPEAVMNAFKAYATRALNKREKGKLARKRWSRHGSTIYLWEPEDVRAAIEYVAYEQGPPMALYVGTPAEPRP
jgi:REP element-mobilizing transposase RayT